MKENQERAEVERNRNLRYGGNTGNSTELNDFLSDDKGQGSQLGVPQERFPKNGIRFPSDFKLNFSFYRHSFKNQSLPHKDDM